MSLRLNDGSDVTDVTLSGKSFHPCATATGNAQLPTVESLVRENRSPPHDEVMNRTVSDSLANIYVIATLCALAASID